MKSLRYLTLSAAVGALFLTSCVPNRKFKASQAALESARNDSARLAGKVADQETAIGQLKQQVGDLNGKVNDLQNQAGKLSSDVANKNSQLGRSQKELERLQALMDQQKKAT